MTKSKSTRATKQQVQAPQAKKANFKMAKRSKTLISLLKHKSADVKSAFKAMLIQGQIAASMRPTKEKSGGLISDPV